MTKQLSALGVLLLLSATTATVASAHVIPKGGVSVDCQTQTQTVTVTVTAWAGNVEIVGNGKTTERMPSPLPDGSASFTVKEIGGDGKYTAGRQGYPKDPPPVAFVVACSAPSPSPSVSPSPSPTPTPTPTPSPTPTGGTSPATINPTPSAGGGLGQGVLAANTTAPGLPAAGAGPGDPRGGFIVALLVALVSVLAIARLVKARR